MKKRNMLITLGLALGLGIGVAAGVGARREIKEAKADGVITVYFAGVGDFASNEVHISLDDSDWHTANATTGAEKAIGQWKTTFTADSSSTLYAYMNENSGGTYWHPEGGTEWDTNYSSLGSVSLSSGHSYIITYTGFSYGYGNDAHKWFNFTVAEYSTNTIYSLDKTGTLLGTNHYAHVWASSASSDWQGIAMASVSGHIYSVAINSALDSVVFNNAANKDVAGVEGTNQTANLTIQAGKCFVLESDWTGSWVSLEAAQFIDENMRFDTISTSDTTKGTACKSFWSDVHDAYNALSTNAVRLEVLSVAGVSARLAAWAEANGATLDTVSGGVFATAGLMSSVDTNNNNNATLIIVVISSLVLISVGGFFLLRKKREN